LGNIVAGSGFQEAVERDGLRLKGAVCVLGVVDRLREVILES